MKRLTSFVIFLLLFLSSAFAQPRSAREILNEAKAEAANFIQILWKTTSINQEQLFAIQKRFRQNE